MQDLYCQEKYCVESIPSLCSRVDGNWNFTWRESVMNCATFLEGMVSSAGAMHRISKFRERGRRRRREKSEA